MMKRIFYILDIKSNARGYEELADIGLRNEKESLEEVHMANNVVFNSIRMNMNNLNSVKQCSS